MDVPRLLDELCELESARLTRPLSPPEHARWLELQKTLTRALCDFSTGAEERRATLRVPCPLAVKVATPHATFDATAIDISDGGIGVKSALLPGLGERVVLVSAHDPDGGAFVLGIAGHVVWLRKLQHELGAGFGIAFEPENETQRQHLAALLLFLLRRERARRAE